MNFGERLRQLRSEHGISQRALAREGVLSFAQIQRVEHGTRDIYLDRASRLLGRFGYELKIARREPCWQILCEAGLPLYLTEEVHRASVPIDEHNLFEQMERAHLYLQENLTDRALAKHRDAYKALLFALRSHYMSVFAQLTGRLGDLATMWELDRITGKDLKLRDIAVSRISAVSRRLPRRPGGPSTR